MCERCERQKAAAEKAGMVVTKVVLGTLSPEAVREITVLEDAEERLNEQYDAEVERLVHLATIEIDATVRQKFEKPVTDLSRLQDKTLKAALRDAGISVELAGQSIGIDRETGVVTSTSVTPKGDIAPGLH